MRPNIDQTDEYAQTIRPSVGSTIRPDENAATLAAPQSIGLRELPSLSVDLRASAAPPAPDATTDADLELVEIIGEGGMGRVFLARQHSLSRDVAVKTPLDGSGPATSAALVAEGRITGQLEHPAIVPVHALGLDKQGKPAMVMKRIEGVEWERLARDPDHPGWGGWPGTAEDRTPGHLQIFITICNALHFAHSRGIIHRDVKLENVLIGRFGDVYLADWGIAERAGTLQAALCGTPGYLAPEMLGGHVVDARTDVYLLGATLHDILTGGMRHASPNVAMSVLKAADSAPFVYEASVPVELAELCNRACHKNPDERPQSAEALRDEVTKILSFRSAAELSAEAQTRTWRIRSLLKEKALSEDGGQELEHLIAQATFAFERAFATGWLGTDAAVADRDWLEALLAKRRARLVELERRAQEHDPRVGAKQRALALSALAACGLTTTLYALYSGHQTTRLELFLFPLLLLLIASGFAVNARKELTRTAYSRRAVGMVLILLGSTCVSRGLNLVIEATTAQQLSQDSLMMAAGLAVGSLAWASWLRWMALCLAVSYIACNAWPEQAITSFGVLSALSLFVAAGFQWAESRRARAPSV